MINFHMNQRNPQGSQPVVFGCLATKVFQELMETGNLVQGDPGRRREIERSADRSKFVVEVIGRFLGAWPFGGGRGTQRMRQVFKDMVLTG